MDTAAPKCAGCGLPMHPVLALQLGWVDHPCCDADYQDEVRRQNAATGRAKVDNALHPKKDT